jgi:tetratricopeptide (TPR) repeat protein
MTELKAFVGHSFLKEDEEVVRAFLDFFNNVKEMRIGFDWENAKPAEPKTLAEKVKELTIGKNVFIGICTKRECVLEPDKLERVKFRKGTLKARNQDLVWKTSDWLIQEIGLCIGRNMQIILIVEDEMRRPGGLQGDLEYITFNRNFPEKSFGKILEMLTALIPKAIAQTAPAGSVPKPEKKEKREIEQTLDWLEPKEDWTRRNFEIALFHMIGAEDKEGEQKITSAYLSSPEGQKEENKISWESFHEYIRIVIGKKGSLEKLEDLAQIHPKNSEILGYLAKAFLEYEEHEKAGTKFLAAGRQEKDGRRKIAWLSDAAIAFARAGNAQNKCLAIEEMKISTRDVGDDEIVVVDTLRQIAEIEKDNEIYLACTERLLDLRPDDNDIRFKIAYKYSEIGRENLALFHYTKIPYRQRSSATWNNIGVANTSLSLNSNAVDAYRKSEELGETLAMSNLANKYIAAGFLREAGEICARATKIENYDKEVGNAISRIKEVIESERGKQEEILKGTKGFREFYRDFGRACSRISPSSQRGTWEGPRFKLEIEIKDGQLTAEGSYEVRSLASLASAMAGWKESLQAPAVTRTFIRYDGVLTGLAVKCRVAVEGDQKALSSKTLLTAIPELKEALMIVSDDLNEIRVYEKDASETQKFYLLKRIES